jgi:hypothetical protein
VKKSKQHRNTIDSRIAGAKTHTEKQSILARGRAEHSTKVQLLVQDWKLVVYWRDHPEKRPPYYDERFKYAVQASSNFIRDAFLAGDFKQVATLAKEMKHPSLPARIPLDKHRWALLKTIEPAQPVEGYPPHPTVSQVVKETVAESMSKAPEPKDAAGKERFERTKTKRLDSTKRGAQKILKRWRATVKKISKA